MNSHVLLNQYLSAVTSIFTDQVYADLSQLADELYDLWLAGKQRVFVIGNGGSAANAIHIANDLIYCISADKRIATHRQLPSTGLSIEALPSNSSVLTCLGNDIGFDQIFSYQLQAKATPGDVLISLSGSGNSVNVINAIKYANQIGMKTYSMLGFDGGLAKSISSNVIHFCSDDMQACEDAQLISAHCLVKLMIARSAAEINCA